VFPRRPQLREPDHSVSEPLWNNYLLNRQKKKKIPPKEPTQMIILQVQQTFYLIHSSKPNH
jgi:hypothetical protein